MNRKFTATTILTLIWCVTNIASANAVNNSRAMAWADSIMGKMTLRERVSQLFCPRLDVRDNAAGREAIRRMVQHEKVGGILLGKGTITEYAKLNNYAQSLAATPLMITLDGEWGPAMRLTDAVRFPYNIALGAIRDTTLLYDYGKEVARQCRELGINVDFAPVLDVNSNPQNPVIGYRSFGEDPKRVGLSGRAFARGLEAGGVISVAKHFPGHGDTSADSHKTLPAIAHDKSTMEQVDLLPFKLYINAGLSGIMVGHLKVPSLDSSGTPASLSREITTNLLQNSLGFKGLVFTDALAMKGAANSNKNNCVAALQAGADVLLGSGAPANDIIAVMKAIKKGTISEDIINDRCRKLLVYKYRMGLAQYTPVNTAGLMERINSPQAYALVEKLANASITVLRDKNNLLPIKDLAHRSIALVSIGTKNDNEFARYCRKYAQITELETSNRGLSRQGLNKADKSDIIIAAIFGSPQAAETVLAQISGKNVITVYFDTPFKMSKIPALGNARVLVTAYDKSAAFQRAAAMALFGGIDVTGRFPVNIKGIATKGQGIDLKKSRLGYLSIKNGTLSPRLDHIVDSICEQAISHGAMTGCQVVVSKNGYVLLDKAYGKINSTPHSPAVTENTLFDIASMTKACATLPGLMLTIDESEISLKAPISRYVPELQGTDKENITVHELLIHQSGMPPVINMWKLMMDTSTYAPPLIRNRPQAPNSVKIDRNAYGNANARLRRDILSANAGNEYYRPVSENLWISDSGVDTIMSAVYAMPLRKKTYLYSCLNFCLLKTAQENVTGVDLDQWADTRIFAPIGAWHTTYLPLQRFKPEDIAYTENDRFLRQQHLHGYVHDELAAFSGGVQGNAGLFATAGDIAKYSQMLLNGGTYGGEQIISSPTVKQFTSTTTQAGRALGFDLLKRNKSLAPDGYDGPAYGHTGSTGTCFWVDPAEQLIIVILTNRVNPSRDNPVFSRLNPRGAIIREIYSAL